METYLLLKLRPQLITPEAFQAFGQVIFAAQDDQPYGDRDAQLHLQNGTPRFYIMRQHNHGLKFSHITRHQRCTQCLGALGGQEWFAISSLLLNSSLLADRQQPPGSHPAVFQLDNRAVQTRSRCSPKSGCGRS